MKNKGFTLVEILVAMLVLAVGLLGMAAMTALVVRGNKGAGDLTSATNICQLKLEELKDQTWDTLGSIDAYSNLAAHTLGLSNAQMYQEADLNSQGKNVTDSPNAGPYKFNRTFVVCKGTDYGGPSGLPMNSQTCTPFACATPTSNEQPSAPDCRVDPNDTNTRSRWLGCFSEDISTATGSQNREKKLKVLCSWRDGSGQCHSVHLDTTVVKLN